MNHDEYTYIKVSIFQRRSNTMTNEKIAEQLAELKEAFDLFDLNRDGTIAIDVLKDVIDSITLKPTEAELFAMLESVDANLDSKIDLPEFLIFVFIRSKHTDSVELLNETIDNNENGWITAGQLSMGINDLMDKTIITQEEADKLLETIEIDQNGLINYEKFVEIYVLDALHELKKRSKTVTNQLRADQLEELRAALNLYDIDEDGTITSEELKEVISSLKLIPTEAKLDAIIAALDVNQNGKIDLAKFLAMMTISIQHKDSKMLLIQMFNEYDTDNDGWISGDELKEGMRNLLGLNIDHFEAEGLFNALDYDENEEIKYEEFVKLYVNDALLDLINDQKIANQVTSEDDEVCGS